MTLKEAELLGSNFFNLCLQIHKSFLSSLVLCNTLPMAIVANNIFSFLVYLLLLEPLASGDMWSALHVIIGNAFTKYLSFTK